MCDRCEELEEEVRQLKALVAGKGTYEISGYGLTPSQEAIFGVLHRSKGRVVTRDHLMTAVGADAFCESENPENLLSVHICKLRKKLREADGPIIKSVNGQGYLMEDTHGR